MENNKIEDYIKKLQQFEKDLNNNEESENNSDFIIELDKLLKGLSEDIQESYNSNSVQIKLKKLHPNAVIPTYSKLGDAGMDLTITEIISETNGNVTYGFGIAIEIPTGYVGLIFPRSSIRNYNLLLSNSVGIIDSGYRGEIQATFKETMTLENKYKQYKVGDRGAQLIIIPYPQITFIESDNLSETDRNIGGYGHTGN